MEWRLGWAIFSESYGINTKIQDHVRTCLGVTWSEDEASGTSGTPGPLSISKIMDLCLFLRGGSVFKWL